VSTPLSTSLRSGDLSGHSPLDPHLCACHRDPAAARPRGGVCRAGTLGARAFGATHPLAPPIRRGWIPV